MSSSEDAPRPLRPVDSDLTLSLDSSASSTSTVTSPHAARHSDSRLIHPRPSDMDEHEKDDIAQGPSNSALGQFSFAPTTRTTVVTTTTTTTTAFPPLIFRPPRATKDLDTRQYPLAASPTPAALRNLRFKIGDQSIVFNEPEDTNATATEVRLSISISISTYLPIIFSSLLSLAPCLVLT